MDKVTVTIDTAIGATVLILGSGEYIYAQPVDGWRVNGVVYSGNLRLGVYDSATVPGARIWKRQLREVEGFGDDRSKRLIEEYSNFSLSRRDDWSKAVSDKAKQKALDILTAAINDWASGLLAKASLRRAEYQYRLDILERTYAEIKSKQKEIDALEERAKGEAATANEARKDIVRYSGPGARE